MAVIFLVLAAMAGVGSAQQTTSKPRPVPGRDPGGVAIAIIGSGVNYTLPVLASRFARDGEGDIIGLDFEDRDNRPFDVDPAVSVLAGTTIASVLAKDAPKARFVPIRARDNDARTVGGLMAFIASSPARIAIAPASTLAPHTSAELIKAAMARPEILLVIAAGDDGADLTARTGISELAAVPSVLIVTAADASGKLLPRSNRGRFVSLTVAASRLKALSREGQEKEIEGSHLAAARVAALASRLKARDPRLEGAALRAKILTFARAGLLLAPSEIESGD